LRPTSAKSLAEQGRETTHGSLFYFALLPVTGRDFGLLTSDLKLSRDYSVRRGTFNAKVPRRNQKRETK
jgi:hypothetical protein